MTDNRDGKVYKTVCIGNQVWMAENLNYNAPGSVCYENNNSNCVTFGKLYDWNTVMQGGSASNSSPSGVQGICPEGWHLPSKDEWTILINTLGGTAVAGELLRDSLYWDAPVTASTNSSGFSARPGGYEFPGVFFDKLGERSNFWSASMGSSSNPWLFSIDSQSSLAAELFVNSPTVKMSCRCVKD